MKVACVMVDSNRQRQWRSKLLPLNFHHVVAMVPLFAVVCRGHCNAAYFHERCISNLQPRQGNLKLRHWFVATNEWLQWCHCWYQWWQWCHCWHCSGYIGDKRYKICQLSYILSTAIAKIADNNRIDSDNYHCRRSSLPLMAIDIGQKCLEVLQTSQL